MASCGDPQGGRPRLGLLRAEKEEEKEEKGGGGSAGPRLAGHRAPSPATAGKGREGTARSVLCGGGKMLGRRRRQTPNSSLSRCFTWCNTQGQSLLARGHAYPVLFYPVTALTAQRGTGHPAQEAAQRQLNKQPNAQVGAGRARTTLLHTDQHLPLALV